MHDLSNFTVVDGNIFCKSTHYTITEDFTMLFDADTGTVIKYGDKSKVENYLEEAGDALSLVGNSFTLLLFSDFGALSKDEICTLAGWLCNTISAETFYAVVHSTESELRERIASLQKIGW